MQNLYRTAAVVTVFSAIEHGLGFLYRIILSRLLGPEGLGVYQVSLTVFAVFLTATSSGLPITLSRTISKHRARGSLRGERASVSAAILLALLASLPVTLLLYALRTPFTAVFSDRRCADLFYILLPSLSFTSVYAVLRGCFWGNRRFLAYSLVELVEEIVMIITGISLLLFFPAAAKGESLAAAAVLVSYLCSFGIAAVYFFATGGRLVPPRGELLPLIKSSVPVTAMRTSSSLVNSLISVIFPLRLAAAGVSSAQAMAEYGVVYGMTMPVLTIPATLIGSIAIVLVPELAESFYKQQREKLSSLVERALNATLLITGLLIPVFLVCGGDIGALLYSNAASGVLISRYALMLLPMGLTMISTSILNSLGCERQTLLFFLGGAAAMLVCVWFLPEYLGSDALCVGMVCNHLLSAGCALALLRKKTGKLHSWKYLLKIAAAEIPIVAAGHLVRKFLVLYLGELPALLLCLLFLAGAELALFSALRLVDLRALWERFFGKRRSNRGVRRNAKEGAAVQQSMQKPLRGGRRGKAAGEIIPPVP